MRALNGDFFVYEFIKKLLTSMAAWRPDNLIFLRVPISFLHLLISADFSRFLSPYILSWMHSISRKGHTWTSVTFLCFVRLLFFRILCCVSQKQSPGFAVLVCCSHCCKGILNILLPYFRKNRISFFKKYIAIK